MAKGDDAKLKKKNKAVRKRINRDPSTAVSSRVAAIIAAKKRRHTGKRRQCQGMCFSLPSPEDPFNDRRGRDDTTSNKSKKPLKASVKVVNATKQEGKCPGSPSKFLFNCLNSIREFLVVDGKIEENGESFIANTWGFEFWKSYCLGMDMLEKSGNSPSVQQIGWIASTAADSIQRKESEMDSLNNPFLLYLVPSQAKAVEVRSVCKPLKVLGIHTVSLHAGSSVEHQVNGLKSCDPEFVVATPERLWELITLKEIDISAVALLVVDALGTLSNCLDIVKCIRDSISGNPQTILFQGGCKIQAKQLPRILREPVATFSLDDTTGRPVIASLNVKRKKIIQS